jgi:hypothetical protein
MGVYPLVLIPSFLVPLSALLHLAALRRLRKGGAELMELSHHTAS